MDKTAWKKVPKTGAERMREYRARKKRQKHAEDELNVKLGRKRRKQPASDKERARKYRLRKKLQKIGIVGGVDIHEEQCQMQQCFTGLCSCKYSYKTHKRVQKQSQIEIKPECDDKSTILTDETQPLKPTEKPIDNPFNCKYCRKSFRQKYRCEVHERLHTGEKPFKCPICSKSFHERNLLAKHQHSHTDERPYACNVCFKTFKSRGCLRLHDRTHTGEKPFACTFCAKRFAQMSVLQRHERIHTGEKPFVCRYCSRAFNDRGTWQKHERRHCKRRGGDEVLNGIKEESEMIDVHDEFYERYVKPDQIHLKHCLKADEVVKEEYGEMDQIKKECSSDDVEERHNDFYGLYVQSKTEEQPEVKIKEELVGVDVQ